MCRTGRRQSLQDSLVLAGLDLLADVDMLVWLSRGKRWRRMGSR